MSAADARTREEKIDAMALALIGATAMFPDPEHAARYYAEKALNALEDLEYFARAALDASPERP